MVWYGMYDIPWALMYFPIGFFRVIYWIWLSILSQGSSERFRVLSLIDVYVVILLNTSGHFYGFCNAITIGHNIVDFFQRPLELYVRWMIELSRVVMYVLCCTNFHLFPMDFVHGSITKVAIFCHYCFISCREDDGTNCCVEYTRKKTLQVE